MGETELMSLTILEERKIWGLLPREIAYYAAMFGGIATGLVTFAAVFTGLWFFWIGTVTGGFAVLILMKLFQYLRALPYEAYDEEIG